MYWIVSLRLKLKNYQLVKGIVVGHQTKKKFRIGRKVNYIYSTKIEYMHPANDEKKIYIDPVSTFWRRFKIGEHLTLFLIPNNYKESPILDTFLSKYLGIIICTLIGFLFTWSSIAFWLGWKNLITP
ncbi:hypothetical protein MHK_001584 [Candidatus Magnetomorum sp. HK-1]|nr:hypothetical protein MHK_001584 [Candidatus Magnetomorum sp. HK-1]